MRKSTKLVALAVAGITALTGCTSESKADTASRNASIAAENFEVQRLIVATDTFNGEVLFSAEGRCSLEIGKVVTVTCKHGEGDIRKHYMGISDNVFWAATQLEGIDADEYHTRIIFKPENIIPNFDLETSSDIERNG